MQFYVMMAKRQNCHGDFNDGLYKWTEHKHPTIIMILCNFMRNNAVRTEPKDRSILCTYLFACI